MIQKYNLANLSTQNQQLLMSKIHTEKFRSEKSVPVKPLNGIINLKILILYTA